MEIKVIEGDICKIATSALVVNLFEGVAIPGGATGAVDKALNNQISDVIKSGRFTGKLNKVLIFNPKSDFSAKYIVIVGLGKKEEFNLDKIRQVSGLAAVQIREAGIKDFVTIIHGAGIGGFDIKEAASALTEGTLLALYKFDRYKTQEKKEIKAIDKFTIVERDKDKIKLIKDAVSKTKIITDEVNFARDLTNLPANELNPSIFAKEAKRKAKELNLQCEILEKEDMEKLGFGALLAVAQGSCQEPKFITLKYQGSKENPVVLIGKGITFDSGGISLKPSNKMDEMKGDMAGAAAVLGSICAVAKLKLPVNLVVMMPLTENMPGGKATKPGDIVKSLSGKYIEIVNTDAEGRLILADALTWAAKLKPKAVIDVATLTGACVVALGNVAAGLLGTDKNLVNKIKTSADKTAEKIWELPLWEEYDELIKSDVADIKNVGDGTAGTITGAMFLRKFVGDLPWAHLDIAGVAWISKGKPYTPKGGTGFGVRLLVQLMKDLSLSS
ncbi:MAG: leucyl aminopeptidase [Candidatus Firestonebacteria bacterium]